MSRLNILTPQQAPEQSRAILDAVASSLGVVPNVIRILSLSPNALAGFASLQAALGRTLTRRARDQIALAVSEVNGCRYCLSAHAHFSSASGSLSDAEIERARRGGSDDPKIDAAVRFATKVATTRGKVDATDLAAMRDAGYSDSDVVDVIALTAQFSMTNLVNNVFDTEPDFEPLADLG